MNLTRRDFIRGLGALIGVTVASQFGHQLETLARVLSGPQERTLTFDEPGLERLIEKQVIVECSLDISERDLWALATLTDPDGGEWHTMDGENWTCGEREMRL